jgi:hypothetical protein
MIVWLCIIKFINNCANFLIVRNNSEKKRDDLDAILKHNLKAQVK